MRNRVNLRSILYDPASKSLGAPKPNKAFLERDVSIKYVLGLEKDGKTVSGSFWASLRDSADTGFADNELCSEACSWPKETRLQRSTEWSELDLKNLKMLRPAYENDKRGACMIASSKLIGKTCKEVSRLVRI